jgi:hypothetical protein
MVAMRWRTFCVLSSANVTGQSFRRLTGGLLTQVAADSLDQLPE